MNPENLRFWDAIAHDFSDLLDFGRLAHLTIRLVFAALLGGLLGYEREMLGKPAGIRTHMLVSVGAAFLLIVPQLEGFPLDAQARVVQGIVTGIGFLGAGSILKLADRQQITGLTTAASIWLTAAVGVSVGFGRLGTSIVGTILAFTILRLLQSLERKLAPHHPGQ